MAWQERYIDRGAMMDDMRSTANPQWIASRSQPDAVTHLRVLIVGVGTLLDYSIITLLTDEPNLLVEGLTYRSEDEFLQRVSELQPDVILICESGEFRASTVTDLLGRRDVMPDSKVIVARLDSNILDVCERVTISHSDDLLTIIHKADHPS